MAQAELRNSSLIPLALVAGILSGGLWRGSSPAETGKTGDQTTAGDKGDSVPVPVPWFSDLRPVLETLDAALGAQVASARESPVNGAAGVALAETGRARDQQILEAMQDLQTGLDCHAGLAGPDGCGDIAALQPFANVLAAWMVAGGDEDGRTRPTQARALLDEFRDLRLFTGLASRLRPSRDDTGEPTYSVDFIVATIPDYVDSNSGWSVDAELAAIQSAMAERQYLFDRVKLVDWSRSSTSSAAVLSASRLHERQPGAVVFRKIDEQTKTVHLQVVLTVLETPTAGVHQVALRNSLLFLRALNAGGRTPNRRLRVLGPHFSGSTASLATILGEEPFHCAFSPRIVITGSANADGNVSTMETFSHGAIFRATVQPTSVLQSRMAAYLESINSRWKDGNGVALLNESNTAYGRNSPSAGSKASDSTQKEPAAFPKAHVFYFPLHIAQLRSDAPSLEQPGAALLSGPAIPLNLRETAPPSDVIPPLRPQLTGPVVASTVDSILDAIRHENMSAVGILATDDRDVLFLAREVKRAAPDVQLFLFGTHSLYLHPDYVAYLRGAVVASSYALTLANQPEIVADGLNEPERDARQERRAFPSMPAEGVFYATRTLVSLSEDGSDWAQLPYCRSRNDKPCVPIAPLSINVVGEDGYWTLPDPSVPHESGVAEAADTTVARAEGTTNDNAIPPPAALRVAPLPPVPLQFLIPAIVVLVIVAVHLWVLLEIKRVCDGARANRSFLELPLVRVLAPPLDTLPRAASLHRFALTVCFVLLSLAAAWAVTTVLPFLLPESAQSLVFTAAAATFVGGIYVALKCYVPGAPVAGVDRGETPKRRPRTLAESTGWLLFVGMVATGLLLVTFIGETALDAADGARGRLALARIVGGGIVSPAALTILLAASLYVVVFTGVRRLSLVGFGYQGLEGADREFALYTTEPASQSRQGRLASLLDMPGQSMPSIYPIALLLILLVAVIGTRRVTTIEGPVFTWFVMIGTWTTLGAGLLQLAQGLALWHAARAHLKRLAQTPIEKHLEKIAPMVPWDISLAPPRLTELTPVANMADSLIRDFRSLAFAGRYGAADHEVLRDLGDVHSLAVAEYRLGCRPGDLASVDPLFAEPSHVNALKREMSERQHAAIVQSRSWFDLWRLSDALVAMLQRTAWVRCTTTAAAEAVRRDVSIVQIFRVPDAPARMMASTAPIPERHGDAPHHTRSATDASTWWFLNCERFVALQAAFVLRDIVARTITSLFAAMLCLTLLTAAHLLYVFSGRASLLTVDMLAVAATALTAIWILVDMERDHVLSRLRTTTPGRVDINWDFIKRIAVYGLLPLIAVIATIFPEVGGTLFGWLEPLRKLSSF